MLYYAHLKHSHNKSFAMVKISSGKLPTFPRKFGPETFRSEIEPMSDNCLPYIRNSVVEHFKNSSKIFFSFLFFSRDFHISCLESHPGCKSQACQSGLGQAEFLSRLGRSGQDFQLNWAVPFWANIFVGCAGQSGPKIFSYIV